jgi:ribosomal protein S18 acetylase RimI-like enzyme
LLRSRFQPDEKVLAISQEKNMSSDRITLRPARAGDDEFILEVYASTRADELALTGWDAAQQDSFLRMQCAAQRQHYEAYYPQGEHFIILAGDDPAGRLYTADKEDEIRILDITLLPGHRNKGIGTGLIKEILARAEQSGKLVRIYVESYNPSRRLFERLGFAGTEEDGINVLMQWRSRA